MIEPRIIKGVRPHFVHSNSLFFTKGNSVFKGDVGNTTKSQKIGSYDAGLLKNIGSTIDMVKRVARLGFHDLKPFKEGLIGIQRKAIVFKPANSHSFINTFTGFRGSRPLNLFVHPRNEEVYFGEYFGNENREEVHIYRSTDAFHWEKAWTFPSGVIRHVHGITWDPFRNGIWVLTGDSDEESGLWFTGDDFVTLNKLVSGGQEARTVEIIPTKQGLIIPMDSPLQKNYINFYDIEKAEFQPLCALPGSAFHAMHSDKVYLVSTVTEPSDVNKVNYASIWASLDGKNWKELSRFQKDWVPIKYQFITRYAEVYFNEGNSSGFIIGYGQAIKGKSNSMLIWSEEEVLNFLQ